MDRPPLPDLALTGTENELLLGFLDFYRAAALDAAWGLTDEQLQTTHPPSTLSIARILAHLAFVEYVWFEERLHGRPLPSPFNDLDWEADIDAEMTLGQNWTTDELTTRFNAAVGHSRTQVALATGFEDLSVATNRDGKKWNLRWILIHMIEEYARHCGHADMIRESIDGGTAR